MKFEHVSVLLNECIEGLDIKPNGIYVDGTLGGAGHASVVCSHLSEEGYFIGIDQDNNALAVSKERLSDMKPKVTLVKSNFVEVKTVLENLGIEKIDGMLIDLGVSSHQLDEPSRGFSYMHDAPLDMRMPTEYHTQSFFCDGLHRVDLEHSCDGQELCRGRRLPRQSDERYEILVQYI